MATKGALAGQPALLGPAGDGLGGDLQDGRDLGRPQEGCDPRRRPRRLAVHRDLTRCSGVPGGASPPPAPTLPNRFSRTARALNWSWLPRPRALNEWVGCCSRTLLL